MSTTQTPKKKALDAIDWCKNAFVKLVGKLIKSRRMSAEAKVATELFIRNFVDELVKSNKEWLVAQIVTYAKKKDPEEEAVFSGMRRTFVDQDQAPAVRFNFGNLETVINSAVGFIVAWGPQITGSRKNAQWIYNAMVFVSMGMAKVFDPEHPAFVYSKIIGTPARKILAEYKKRPEMMRQGFDENEDDDDDDNNDDGDFFGDMDDDDDNKPTPEPPTRRERPTRPPATVPRRDMYDDEPPSVRARSPSPPPPVPVSRPPTKPTAMFGRVDDMYS